jgi:hypothetical protein
LHKSGYKTRHELSLSYTLSCYAFTKHFFFSSALGSATTIILTNLYMILKLVLHVLFIPLDTSASMSYYKFVSILHASVKCFIVDDLV